jgi:regulator of sigma E protease
MPLGGYVRFIDEREGGVLPSEQGQTFKSQSLGKRAAIVAAGPISNLLLAVLLYAGSNWIGVSEPRALLASPPAGSLAEQAGLRAGDEVRATSSDGNEWRDVRSMSDLNWEVTQALLHGEPLQLMVSSAASRGERHVTLPVDRVPSRELDQATMMRIGLDPSYSEAFVDRVIPDGPGARAGVQAGDRVLSVDDQPIPDRARLMQLIRATAAKGEPAPMHWRVERGGQTLELTVTPVVATLPDGQRWGKVDLGLGKPLQMVLVRYGFVEGLTQAARRTWEMSTLTLKMFGKMLIGQASLKNISGPITIADYAGQSAKLGLAYYLSFLAIVSVSLGVLNLLPLPVLDGGHLMYYLFEAVTGRPVSELWLARLQRGGLALVVLMMSLALYNDVARLLGLH